MIRTRPEPFTYVHDVARWAVLATYEARDGVLDQARPGSWIVEPTDPRVVVLGTHEHEADAIHSAEGIADVVLGRFGLVAVEVTRLAGGTRWETG